MDRTRSVEVGWECGSGECRRARTRYEMGWDRGMVVGSAAAGLDERSCELCLTKSAKQVTGFKQKAHRIPRKMSGFLCSQVSMSWLPSTYSGL